MDNETLIHVLNIGSVVLACMSAACVVGAIITVYRWHRQARTERPRKGAPANSLARTS